MKSFYAVLIGAASIAVSLSAESTASHTLEPITVSDAMSVRLPEQRLQNVSFLSQTEELSETLRSLPGIHLRSSGPHGGEPVIRGLGWERVKTDFNGLSLHGACPSRMDPPASQLNAATAQSVEVDLMAPSVVHGPGGLGGRIRVDTELRWNPDAPVPLQRDLRFFGNTQGKHRGTHARVQSETTTSAVRAEAGYRIQDDIFAGDGTRVPAGREAREVGADGSWKAAENLALRFAYRRIEERDIDFPALPMDSRFSDVDLLTFGSRWTPQDQALRELDVRVGLQRVDHLMDNRDKPNRGMMQAFTPATADTLSGRILSRWNLLQGEYRLGMDAYRLEREATRTRFIPSTGMTFQDPIWPDLTENQIGLFNEWQASLSQSRTLRLGLRLDHIQSRADQTDLSVMPGQAVRRISLREAYRRFGGADRADSDQDFTLLSGNLQLSQALTEDWTLTGSAARIASAPNQTQLFQGFGARPGGFGVGNPDLDPEVKHQIELRTDGTLGAHHIGIAVHAARIEDYLLTTTLNRIDITGDGMPNRILGTRNVDATLIGAEAGMILDLPGDFSLPVQLAWVRGENRDDDRPLPEIPPIEGQAALRWERNMLIEFGVRFAGHQDRIDSAFGENETPGFAVLHLRMRHEITPGWTLEAGIDNLLDKTYNEHLTREAVLAGGDLRPGDEVPSPGRSLQLALRAIW